MRTRNAAICLLALLGAFAMPARAQDDPATMLDFANGLFVRGLYQEAAREYRRYLDAAGANAQADAWYRMGESAFASEDYEAAREAFMAYRGRAPQGEHAERATLRLGETLQRLERPREAIPHFEGLSESASTASVRAAALYGLGRALIDDDNPQGAMRPFLRLIQEHPNDPRTPFGRFQLAHVYLSLDQADEAARLYEAVANDAGDVDAALRREARLRAAESYARAGETDRAIAAYEALVREAPAGPYAERAAYGLAWSAHAAGEFDRAAQSAARFVESHPESDMAAAARYLRGHALQELGRLSEATAAYEALILAEPDSPFSQRASIRLAWVRYLDGDGAGAKTAARRLLDTGGLAEAEAGDAHYLIALIDADAGDHGAALAGFERVMTEYIESSFATDAAYKRAESLARLGRTGEAAVAFEAFATQHPGHGLAREALLRGGDAAFFDADFAEAIAQYERVLESDPEPEVEALTRYRLALSHHNAGNHEQSAAAFKALLERFPDTEHAAEAHLRIGEHHLEEGEAGPALNAFQAVLDANAGDANAGDAMTGRALRGAGLAQYQLGNFDEAANRLARVIADFPAVALDPDTALWLGQYLFDQERYAQAAQALERLLDTTPPYPNRGAIQFKLAESLELDGQTDAALAAFAKVAALEPDSAWSLDAGYRQALLLEAKGDTGAARAKFEEAARVLEGEAPARARLRLAAMDANAGDHAAAARGYMMIAVLYDDPALTPEALMGAARAYAASGESAKARACYEELLRDYPDWPGAGEARNQLAALTP